VATIGAFEAKAQFSALLDRAAKGEEIVITKHGRAVARLVAAEEWDRRHAEAAAEKLKTLRKGTTLGRIPWQTLRDAGRR